MIKLIAAILLSLSSAVTVVYVAPRSVWQGGSKGGAVVAPEIDPSSAASALTLLLGGVAVLRSRAAKRQAYQSCH